MAADRGQGTPWRQRTNIWRIVTSPALAKKKQEPYMSSRMEAAGRQSIRSNFTMADSSPRVIDCGGCSTVRVASHRQLGTESPRGSLSCSHQKSNNISECWRRWIYVFCSCIANGWVLVQSGQNFRV